MRLLRPDGLRDPIVWNTGFQLLKTVLAAVLAWLLAVHLFHLQQPFLAPWSALLVVHATVYRTFSRGLQQVAATVTAVVLAAAVGHVLGASATAIGVMLVVSLALGSLRWFGAEGTTLATTALVVLTTGFQHDNLLLERLLDTGIGVTVGLAVNIAVWPPLRRRVTITALDAIDDEIAALLTDLGQALADGPVDMDVQEWMERTRGIDDQLERAWGLVRQTRESAWLNPRRPAREVRDPQEWYGLLHRMEQAVAEVRSLLRTVELRLLSEQGWGDAFTAAWTRILVESGRAVADADPVAIVEVRARLEELVDATTQGPRMPERWPVQGALVINLRNILDSLDEVAAANPMRQPPLPRLPRPTRTRRERAHPDT